MKRFGQTINSHPLYFFHLVRLADFYFIRIHFYKKRHREPMSIFAILLSENVMRRHLLFNLTLATIFFQNFLQNIFFERQIKLKLTRAGIPTTMFIPTIFCPLVHEEVPLAIVTIKRSRDADIIKTYFLFFHKPNSSILRPSKTAIRFYLTKKFFYI